MKCPLKKSFLKARSISPGGLKGDASQHTILSQRPSTSSQLNLLPKVESHYLSLPQLIRNKLIANKSPMNKASQSNQKNPKKGASSNNSRMTPKKQKISPKVDAAKINSIVKSNLKKNVEAENQKKEEEFLQALQYQDKLQRMRLRNQEIRRRNEEDASRSRSKSRSKSPAI